MSRKKLISIALLMCTLFACIALAACKPKHTHNYNLWQSDDETHVKVCLCGKEFGQKEPHSVDDWQVETPATETSTGLRSGTCTQCKRKLTQVIPQIPPHTHTPAEGYQFSSNYHFKRCSVCNQAMDIEPHQVDDWIVDKQPTAYVQGRKHGQCVVCKGTVEQLIPALDHVHSFVVTDYDDDSHWYKCAHCDVIDQTSANPHNKEWVVDVPATTTSQGLGHYQCNFCGKQYPQQTIPQLTGQPRNVDLYAINDFHGEVDRISAVSGYLKERKNANPNTLIINSGDMFQGSMESNSNYGKLLTDCMSAAGFDALTLGNHEFDWGLSKLQTLSQTGSVRFLGANVYRWNASTKTWGDFADDLAQKYVVKTLSNGLKVGIIGVIGKDQITSISSNLVQTIGFKDPLPIVKELATELRTQVNCDVVVVSAHASPRGLVGESEDRNDPEQPASAHGLQDYVDAVFCAHTHRQQKFTVDGLTFIQGGSYGSHVSHVRLSVSSDGEVTCTLSENVSYSNSWPNLAAVDELVNNSNQAIEGERSQVLVQNLSKTLSKNPQMARLVSRAIAQYAKNQGYDVALAMVNTARDHLTAGQVTYAELYKSLPFDNVVYVAKVKGREIINEVNYGNYFWRSSPQAIEENKYYTVAVIDYLLFHQNSNRDYNYFPSAFTSGFTPVALTNANYEFYNYRFITRDYLLNNTVNPNDYIYDNQNTDPALLQQTVTLDFQTPDTWNTNTSAPNRLRQSCYSDEIALCNDMTKRYRFCQ